MKINNTILGIFNDREAAEIAIDRLQVSGYNPKEISVIVRDQEVAHEIHESTGTQVAESAAGGATTGGVIGGIVGLLVGVGAIAIPGIGGVLIGGPLAAALGLTGAAATTLSGAATGALAGGFVGALVGLGVPEETATYYDQRLREGAVLLAVPVRESGQASELKSLFEELDAQQVYSIA